MTKRFFYLMIFSVLMLKISLAQTPVKNDGLIRITFLQLNDVYEIAPLENGAVGGMARVATLRKKLLLENPNTYTVMAGDFLFPSAIGTMQYEGKSIKGRQMIETMNVAGVDLVTFGNHEFDLKENELTDRINQSSFDWISTNVWYNSASGKIPFSKTERNSINPIPQTRVLIFKDNDGTEIKIGLFGMTINATRVPYVSYDDYVFAARDAINKLRDQCDFIIAVTHLSIDDDKMLASKFSEVKLIIGGHEHVHSYDTVGKTIIAKADANARTVYVHKLQYNKNNKQLTIQSDLTKVDHTIADDLATLQVVNKWIAIADKSLRDQGFIPGEVLATVNELYDGRESEVRYTSTNLTRMIAKAFSAAAKETDCSIYNSGSIRLDDELTGAITQYDVIRTLPYGGKILIVEMKGSLLKMSLDSSLLRKGNGCFLQYYGIEKNKKKEWLINGKKVINEKFYLVAVNDYLMSGQQQYLEFLNDKNLGVIRISAPSESDSLRLDLRKAVINYLRQGGK